MVRVPLMKPYLTQELKDRVLQVLDSGMWTEGAVTAELEGVFRSYIGCRHAIAVTSCTTGLELALRALGIGPGDEVIVPDYTYPATADVVAIVGAKIVLVDVSRQTMLIDYDALEEAITPRTKALIPVSLFGNPLDWDRLSAIRTRHDVKVIEDAACSIGAEFKGEKVGRQADISVFSLHPRKFITTGEGGIVTTDNDTLADWMNSYKHFGMQSSGSRVSTEFVRIGTNYKLSNVLSAIGVVQMRHVDELLQRRLWLANGYVRLLEGHPRIEIPATTVGGVHSRQSFCIYVENRNHVLERLRSQGIEVQIGTFSLHAQKAFQDSVSCRRAGGMDGSRHAFDNCLTLPLYHDMTSEEQTMVVDALTALL
jgi:dTDP-4-amino-4,6-dideoxygalactose transaminase